MIDWNTFRYHGLSTAELDELIYAQKMQGYEGLIKENARLRQENARLQHRAPINASAIGQIIQAVLDQGFCVSYIYDRRKSGADDARHLFHRFDVWKYYGEEQVLARLLVDDVELRHAIAFGLPELARCMQQIDEQITQLRLLKEALDG